MPIVVTGAGNVVTLGYGWTKGGHEVRHGAPNSADPKWPARNQPGRGVRGPEAIVLATPSPATRAAVKGLGEHSARISVDSTDPLGMGPGGLARTLGCEQAFGWAGREGAGALKAFNTTGCGNVEDLAGYGVTPVMVAVDDDAARRTAMLGWRAISASKHPTLPCCATRACSNPRSCRGATRRSVVEWGRDFAFAVLRRGR